MTDPASILGPKGRIARRLKQYEHRPEQLAMAQAVAQAISQSRHLVVEAGTGVGKSFAYLVPAILAAAGGEGDDGSERARPKRRRVGETSQAGNPQAEPCPDPSESDVADSVQRTTPRRVIISTHTISLQEQLINKDIPLLRAVLPVEFSAVLVKGRSNYVSLRRLYGAVERSESIFLRDEEFRDLVRLQKWARRTHDGSRSDLSFRPLPQVWDEAESEHGNCLGRKCPQYRDCFYFKARRRAWNAQVLVVNHALFFSDLALRRHGASILPDYNVVVFDEAHNLEAVAGEHLGLALSNTQITYLLNKLYNERTRRGLLVHHNLLELRDRVREVRHEGEEFFSRLSVWQREHGRDNGRVSRPDPVPNTLSEPLKRLASALEKKGKRIAEEEQQIELTAASERCRLFATGLEEWLSQRLADSVYWIEFGGRKRQRVTLTCAPVEVGPTLREQLYEKVPTVVMTSATLAVGREASFSFFKSRLGLNQGATQRLGTPFDYKRQVRLYLVADMPDPAREPEQFTQATCRMVRRYVQRTGGRAFVLFTSYHMLRDVAERLTPWLAEQNLDLFCQGDGLPAGRLLERFRASERSVLFGTDSFWQGVDVPGDALVNVIITKLPFSVPTAPLVEARVEAIRARGGNPFIEFQLPEAAIKLKQGFGRLIRNKTDTGMVAILDPRVFTKPYGRVLLGSLPNCQRVVDSCRKA